MLKINYFLFVLSVILVSCGGGSAVNENKDSEKKSNDTQAVEKLEKEEPKKNWSYGESSDEMNPKDKTKHATCKSTNKIDFKFPYQGGTQFSISLVHYPDGSKSVILYCDEKKCQFMPNNPFSPQELRVKFDEKDVLNWEYVTGNDFKMNRVGLSNYDLFVSNLKGAKKLMIEAPFFSEGKSVIKFDVEGFEAL
jgi:hypothetical protein